MSLSLICAFLWVVVAAILTAIPSSDNLWRRAYFLIAIAVPMLGFVVYQNGPWVGLLVLAGALSILRWPVVHFWRYFIGWARAKM